MNKTTPYTDPLDLLVEEIMDLAREHSIDDAHMFIKDRLVKDALCPDCQFGTYGKVERKTP